MEEKIKAVTSFINRDTTLKDDYFKGWNQNSYGDYLWEIFFEPYNKKYWDIDLSILGCDWINNRIYQQSVEELLYGTYTDKTPNTYYAPEMRYPKMGGYFEYIKYIANKAESIGKMNYGFKTMKVDAEIHMIYFSNGESRRYDRLYISVPMPLMIYQIPDHLKNIEIFDATGVVVVSMGLKKTNLHQMWFYIYDEDIMAVRAYMPSEKSLHSTPEGMTSVQFEIYYYNRKKSALDIKKTIDN